MQYCSNAKINLGLQVLRKRTDGFHDIASLFVPVDWSDRLEIEESSAFNFSQTGISIDGKLENNLCVKAYQKVAEHISIPAVNIHLNKQIPIGAGLGGGSSNAANIIRGLNSQFELGISIEKMEEMAAEIGSDCPFFIDNRPKLVHGRGEELSAFPSLGLNCYLTIVFPSIHVSTKIAYQNLMPSEKEVKLEEILKAKSRWRSELKNDFETTVFKEFPEIRKIKEQLYKSGAWYASMSGSGSAVFGLFDQKPPSLDWQSDFLIHESQLII